MGPRWLALGPALRPGAASKRFRRPGLGAYSHPSVPWAPRKPSPGWDGPAASVCPAPRTDMLCRPRPAHFSARSEPSAPGPAPASPRHIGYHRRAGVSQGRRRTVARAGDFPGKWRASERGSGPALHSCHMQTGEKWVDVLDEEKVYEFAGAAIQFWWLNKTKIYPFTVLEGRSPK